MRVRVLLFASARRAAGTGELDLELAAGARASDILRHARLAAVAPQAAALRFAVNEEFAPADRALSEGDVVALIPPVSGG